MSTPTIIWSTIPAGFKNPSTLRLLVSTTFRLTFPGGRVDGTLADFPALLNWEETLKTLSFEVEFDNFNLESKILVKQGLDNGLWSKLFHSESLVRSYTFDDYSNANINNFSMKACNNIIDDVYTKCGFKYPYEKPRLSEYGITNDEMIATSMNLPITFELGKLGLRNNEGLAAYIENGPVNGIIEILKSKKKGEIVCTYIPNRNFVGQDRFSYKIENKIGDFKSAIVNIQIKDRSDTLSTKNHYYNIGENISERLRLNELLLQGDEEETIEKKITNRLNKTGFIDNAEFRSPNEELYRLKRFHRILNENSDRFNQKNDCTSTERLDVHQVLSRITQYPSLMFNLGLVVEIECPVPLSLFNNVTDIYGKVRVKVIQNLEAGNSDLQIAPFSFWTKYNLNNRDGINRFYPAPGDIDYVKEGMLNVSNKDDFEFHIVDVDSDGQKIINFVTGLRHLALVGNPDDEQAGIPARRSSTLTLSHKKRAEIMKKRIDRAKELNNVIFNPNLVDEIFLTSFDLLKGFRIDVFDSFSKKWNSLCWRRGKYQFKSPADAMSNSISSNSEFEIIDEGFLSLAASISKNSTCDLTTLSISESLMSWDGWGLCIRQPGKTIGIDSKPGLPESHIETDFPLGVVFSAVENKLPLLRFGGKYRFRFRAVDLAGNSISENSIVDPSYVIPALKFDPFVYLRSEPISSPIIVKYRNTESIGESIDTLVIRDYEWEVDSEEGERNMSQRHVAPPRVSQRLAELHGMYDKAFGGDSSVIEDVYEKIKDGNIPQTDPGDTMKINYIPDPMAQGVTILGLNSLGSDTKELKIYQVPFSNDKMKCHEPFYYDQNNDWPNRIPFRLKLAGGKLSAYWETTEANTLTIYLPKSEVLEIDMSCYISNSGLEKMALWKSMYEKDPDSASSLRAAIVLGRHWMFTPSRKIKLVHAVKKPLSSPEFQTVISQRNLGEPSTNFIGRIYVHGKSTQRIVIIGKWIEPSHVDPTIINPVESFQQIIEILPEDFMKSFSFLHYFKDTSYRKIDITAIGFSRFRDYYPKPGAIERSQSGFTDPESVPDEEMTVESVNRWEVEVFNSSRPVALSVRYIVPLFKWQSYESSYDADLSRPSELEGNKSGKRLDSDHNFAGKRFTSKRTGNSLRIYLDPSWYLSGQGELLGVILWSNTPPPDKSIKNFEMPDGLSPYVTQWGNDPIWSIPTYLPSQTAPNLSAFTKAVDFKTQLSLAELQTYSNKNEISVDCAGHQPEYDPIRKLWYCDVDINAGETYFPFIRLALTRYQPKSVPDAHLSPVLLADFIQLTPMRIASIVSNPSDPREIQISIIGPSFKDTTKPTKESIHIMEIDLEIKAKTRNTDLYLPISKKVLESKLDFDNLHTWRDTLILPYPRFSREYRLVVKEYVGHFTDVTAEGNLVYNPIFIENIHL
ncbi:MAG: hypothetical protein AB7V56_12500 [Candidatus Nitrosocosmicus sp.]